MDTKVVLFLPSDIRGSAAIKAIFHEYKGILLSAFRTTDNKLKAEQQKCLEHVVRELQKISHKELEMRDIAEQHLERDIERKEYESTLSASAPKKRDRPAKQPATLSEERRRILEEKKAQCGKASRQAAKFIDFFKNVQNKEDHLKSVFIPFEKRMRTAEALLKALIGEIKEEEPINADIERIIELFGKYTPSLFTYLEHPDVIPDNDAAERKIHSFVVLRKTFGYFISREVLNIHTNHLSSDRTCKRNEVNYEKVLIPLLKGDTENVLILLGLRPAKPPPIRVG
ncbi:MAG: IS66 family transposase [Promethearchaeota archaeon]